MTRIWLRILVCCCGVVVPILICWVTIFSFAGSPVGWEAFLLVVFMLFVFCNLRVARICIRSFTLMSWETQHRTELYQRRYKARPSLPATTFLLYCKLGLLFGAVSCSDCCTLDIFDVSDVISIMVSCSKEAQRRSVLPFLLPDKRTCWGCTSPYRAEA